MSNHIHLLPGDPLFQAGSERIGKTFGPVLQKDHPAIRETSLRNDMLHDMVVPVRIDAEMRIAMLCKCNDCLENAMYIGIAGNAVENSVRLPGHPCTVNAGIGRFRRGKKGKIAGEPVFGRSLDHEGSSPFYVPLQKLRTRETRRRPLVEVPVRTHDGLGRLEHRQDGRNVSEGGRSYTKTLYHLS